MSYPFKKRNRLIYLLKVINNIYFEIKMKNNLNIFILIIFNKYKQTTFSLNYLFFSEFFDLSNHIHL